MASGPLKSAAAKTARTKGRGYLWNCMLSPSFNYGDPNNQPAMEVFQIEIKAH
jgi:hypothetical protein